MKKLLLLIIPALMFGSEIIDGRLTEVVNDNTVVISNSDGANTVNLSGIENGSRNLIIEKCLGKPAYLVVNTVTVGKHIRKAGELFCDDTNINVYMLKNGLAMFNDMTPFNKEYEKHVKQAKAEKIGMWKRYKGYSNGSLK